MRDYKILLILNIFLCWNTDWKLVSNQSVNSNKSSNFKLFKCKSLFFVVFKKSTLIAFLFSQNQGDGAVQRTLRRFRSSGRQTQRRSSNQDAVSPDHFCSNSLAKWKNYLRGKFSITNLCQFVNWHEYIKEWT